jgi:hypothetical protein
VYHTIILSALDYEYYFVCTELLIDCSLLDLPLHRLSHQSSAQSIAIRRQTLSFERIVGAIEPESVSGIRHLLEPVRILSIQARITPFV